MWLPCMFCQCKRQLLRLALHLLGPVVCECATFRHCVLQLRLPVPQLQTGTPACTSARVASSVASGCVASFARLPSLPTCLPCLPAFHRPLTVCCLVALCVRYECNASFDLHNVHILIPLPAGAHTPQVNQVCWCWYPAFVAGAPMPLIAAANRCWAVRTRRKPARCAGVLRYFPVCLLLLPVLSWMRRK